MFVPEHADESRTQIFTLRSVAVGVVAGAIVGSWFRWVSGVDVILAVLNGMSFGVLVWTFYVTMSDGRFSVTPRHWGIRTLLVVEFVPVLFLRSFLDEAVASQANAGAIFWLFLYATWGAHNLGEILGLLEQIDRPENYEPNPRLHLFR